MNEELARMAAQQEMIRKMMQQYSEELKQEGGHAVGELDNLMRQMEQTETDIVNKIINQQTINRQNNILTRMLQHEKAQKKQEQEERRESTEGKDLFENSNNQFLEYNKLKNRELELFKQIPPAFSPYYKEKVNEFFINLKVENK
jgi:phage-related minor tail protein